MVALVEPSKRLEDAVARYHVNAISAVELINELIALAKDMKTARARGEELGLSLEEVAFYEVLAENESAVQAMGAEKLRVIAHELLESLRKNVTIAKRESARARILVKRILKKYGYPPDLAEEAVQTVLAQAEAPLQEISCPAPYDHARNGTTTAPRLIPRICPPTKPSCGRALPNSRRAHMPCEQSHYRLGPIGVQRRQRAKDQIRSELTKLGTGNRDQSSRPCRSQGDVALR